MTAIVQVIDAGSAALPSLSDTPTEIVVWPHLGPLAQRRRDHSLPLLVSRVSPRRALCDLAAAVDAQVKSGRINAAIVVSAVGR